MTSDSDSAHMSNAMHVSFAQPTSLPKGSSHRKLLPLDVQTPEVAGGCADE